MIDRFLPANSDFSSSPSLLTQDPLAEPFDENVSHTPTFLSHYLAAEFARLQTECKELSPLKTYLKTRTLPKDK